MNTNNISKPGITLIISVIIVMILNMFISLAIARSKGIEQPELGGYILGPIILPLLIMGVFQLVKKFRNPKSRFKLVLWSLVFILIGNFLNFSRAIEWKKQDNLFEIKFEQLTQAGDYKKAEDVAQKWLNFREMNLGKTHTEYAYVLTKLGELYFKMGKERLAEKPFHDALEIWQKYYGLKHERTARALNNMGAIYWYKDELDKARNMYRLALTIRKSLFGNTNSSVATTLNNLAWLEVDCGNYTEALNLLETSLKIDQAQHGTESQKTMTLFMNMASIQLMDKRYQEAFKNAEEALGIGQRVLPKNHPELADILVIMAEVHQGLDKPENAVPLLEHALSIYETQIGLESTDVRKVRYLLHSVMRDVNKKQ